jgi:diadenylate cyclase
LDVVDILIVAFLIYNVIKLIRNTTAVQVLKGIALLFVLLGLSSLLQLNLLNFILTATMQVGVIAIIIMFQPELRKMLEQVGASKFSKLLRKDNDDPTKLENVVAQVVSTCNGLSQNRVGALIVFERSVFLNDAIKSGTALDAEVSSMLLKNIFFPKASLHDGAVIIRNGRIISAGCVLPLTASNSLSRDIGTRHRAAVGVSEHSDAVAVIVSEETGSISVAVSGMLKRHLNTETLSIILKNELIPDEEETEKKVFSALFPKLFGKKKPGGE